MFMMKFLHTAFLALALLAGAHRISNIEVKGGWVNLYDESGKKYKSLNAKTVGEIQGYSSTFFVAKNGSWILLYDAEGKKYKDLNANTIGEILSVSGETFTSRSGAWIITWDRSGKKISSRSAR